MKGIIRKLQIKENHVGRIINLPAMLNERFRNWPVELLSNKKTNLDYVVVFVEDKKDIEKFGAQAVKMIRKDGLLWFAYLKKTSNIDTDISRDKGWEVISNLGFRRVRLISLDNNWSIFRFREKTLVKQSN